MSPEKNLPYQNPLLPVAQRVEDLLSRMTLEEKMEQLHCSGCVYTVEDNLRFFDEGKPRVDSEFYTFKSFDLAHLHELEERAVKETRLGIPLFVSCEDEHGASTPYSTIYPTPGCMGAAFDPDLVYRFASASAGEARALGFNKVYAPNLDLLKEPRWGRAEEDFTEDPYLMSVYAERLVKGYQDQGVAATLKHYVASSVPESGLNCGQIHLGEREIREYYLPPFAAGIKAGAFGVMCSYNEIDGIPVALDSYWMKDVLRDELGFKGVLITDYGVSSIVNLLYEADNHDLLALGKMYLDSKIDLEACGRDAYGTEFQSAVEKGEVPVARVDEAVRRILTEKFALGLFEHPSFDLANAKKKVFTARHRQLCYDIEKEGAVLLKNDGVLPLKKNVKIALIGPNALYAQMGGYTYYSVLDNYRCPDAVSEQAITPKAAFEKAFGQANVRTVRGCNFVSILPEDRSSLEKALAWCDVIVFAGGNNSMGHSGGENGGKNNPLMKGDAVTAAEGYDQDDVSLTRSQKELLAQVSPFKKPLVFLVYGGKPVALKNELPGLSALLFVFGVGTDGNRAIADILSGKVNPSGKMPFSIPASVGQLPVYYNHHPIKGIYHRPGTPEKPGQDYVFSSPDPLFDFGFGLSYTTFEYSELEMSKSEGKYLVSVALANKGKRNGTETVLLYVHSLSNYQVSPIVKALKAFQRVSLKPGEKKRVSFALDKESFAYVGFHDEKAYPLGRVEILVGGLRKEFDLWH